ncbi:MAG: tryptophan synthase subunit alpha [Sphingomonadales bacterium]
MAGERRIEARFEELAGEGRAGFIAFITAGDPDREISLELLKGLPGAGADIIELGMPFSDPMADGPSIQAASLRALRGGQTLGKTLDMVREFRRGEAATPIVLMGYFNPILAYGVERFTKDAAAAGVDGLIVVDLPPEEETELAEPARGAGIHLIRLAAPTTTGDRLSVVLGGAGGFLYYVSMTGITGDEVVAQGEVSRALEVLRRNTNLPVAVGFGIKTVEDVRAMASAADAVVVGSAIVDKLASGLDAGGQAKPDLAEKVLDFVRELADGVRRQKGDEKD